VQPTELILFADEWDTKEGTGKSMKNLLRIAVCQKAPLRPKCRRKVKKIKCIALAIVKLCWSEGIR